jgi:hypothetical protein
MGRPGKAVDTPRAARLAWARTPETDGKEASVMAAVIPRSPLPVARVCEA